MKKMMVKDVRLSAGNLRGRRFPEDMETVESLEGFRESIGVLRERLREIMEILAIYVTESWKLSHHGRHVQMGRSVQKEWLEKAMKMKSNKESRDRDFGTMMSQENKDDGKQERMSMDQMVRGPLEAYDLMRGESIQGRVNDHSGIVITEAEVIEDIGETIEKLSSMSVNEDRGKPVENGEVMEDQYPKAVLEDVENGEVMEDQYPQGDMDRDSGSTVRDSSSSLQEELRSDDDSERDGLFDGKGYKMSRPVELQSVSSCRGVKLFTKGEDRRKAGWFGVLDQRGGTLSTFPMDRVMKINLHNVNTVEDYLMDSEDSCKSEGFTLKIMETLKTGTAVASKSRLQRKRGAEGTCAIVSLTSGKPNGRGQETFWNEMRENTNTGVHNGIFYCVIQREGENTRLRFLPLRGRVLKWDRKRMKIQKERMEE